MTAAVRLCTCCNSSTADCLVALLQAEMQDLFNAIDTDGSGTITHEEMMEVGLSVE